MRFLLAIGLLAAAVLPAGCVRRRMLVQSNPPGARVLIDDQEIGVTPVATSYVYYGTRKIQLVRDGFETKTILHPIRPPWYEVPPIDFISENLIPAEFRDERIVSIDLEPERPASVDEVWRRAQDLRGSVQQGFVVPSVPAESPDPNSGVTPSGPSSTPVRRLPLIEAPGEW